MSDLGAERPRGSMRMPAWLARLILAGCLLAPSLWMLATIPPLWRDLDAYNQLTRSPASATYIGHAPLYGFVARVPLYLGAEWERLTGRVARADEASLRQPRLNESGIFLLILLQHLLLAEAAFRLITLASQRFTIRLSLALLWASNPLLYTFAHCVGSESASAVLVVWLVAAGLAIVKSRPEPNWKQWYLFAVLLWLCLLTRHANLVLAFLLPATFLVGAARVRLRAWRAKDSRIFHARFFQQAVVASVIAVVCIFLAQRSMEKLCRSEKREYHSRLGFTFLWRLPFLAALAQDSQRAVLAQVAPRARTPEARNLIPMLKEMLAAGSSLGSGEVIPRVKTTLFPAGAQVKGDRFDAALNDLAWAFLRPPSRELWRAALADLAGALRDPPPTNFLFATTSYYFKDPEAMAQCSGLTTFRDSTPEQLQAIPSRHKYLRFWSGLSCRFCLGISLVALVLITLCKRGDGEWIAVSSLALALTAIGLLIVASTCLLGGILPRYSLPLWEALLISLIISGGTLGDHLADRFTRLARAA